MLDEFFAASIQELHVEVAFDFEFLTSTTVLSSWNSLALLSIFLWRRDRSLFRCMPTGTRDHTQNLVDHLFDILRIVGSTDFVEWTSLKDKFPRNIFSTGLAKV